MYRVEAARVLYGSEGRGNRLSQNLSSENVFTVCIFASENVLFDFFDIQKFDDAL